ncbi:hypothetical protein ACFQY7_01715 [Actinomadura luteofluorescens]|uniref:hypothetical protein n=1 Tax=Actinomadura luteofluorescens TaxID=46163 RepID=UPI0036365766
MTSCFAGRVDFTEGADAAGGRFWSDAEDAPMLGPVVCAALGTEARAIRRGLTRTPVVVVGYRARRADRLPAACAALVVAGFGGALDERLRPGDVLVADEIRAACGGGKAVPCAAPRLLAEEMIRDGLSVQVGPLVTTDRVVRGAERGLLAAQGRGSRTWSRRSSPSAPDRCRSRRSGWSSTGRGTRCGIRASSAAGWRGGAS